MAIFSAKIKFDFSLDEDRDTVKFFHADFIVLL